MKTRKWYCNPYLWLMVAGIAARIGGAILFSSNYSGDHSVPCLMAKHISEGKPIPVFYYGQPYMGSLEPIVSSLFFRLPFSPNFNCNLGTAFFGILLLPLIAWWGQQAGGRKTGLLALGCAIIGPPVYVQFMNWAYGGYAATTFLITATLLCGLRIIQKEMEFPKQSPIWLWLLTGLLAGLGWWTNPMIMVPIVALAVLGFLAIRTRCFQWKLIPAGAMFALGSSPFWIWNYKNNGAAIRFIFSKSANDILGGAKRFLYSMTYALTDFDSDLAACIVLFSLCGLFCISAISWRLMRKKSTGIYLPAAWLLVVLILFFFVRKPLTLGPARYYLPLMPALAVIFGQAMVILNKRTPFKLGYILLALLVLFQASYLPTCTKWFNARHAYFAELDAMEPSFEALDTDVIFTEYFSQRKYGYGLNFYFDEAFCFTELPHNERHVPYIHKGEQAKTIAVLNNMFGITELMKSCGGSAHTTILPNGFLLYDQFQPPPRATTMVTNGFRIVDHVTKEDLTSILSDNNNRTLWRNSKQRNNLIIQINFMNPQQLELLRLVATKDSWPEILQVDILQAGTDQWKQLGSKNYLVPWYWPDHAGRPYAGGNYYRQEIQVSKPHIEALRLIINDNNPRNYVELSELQLFSRPTQTKNTPESSADDPAILLDTLISNQAKNVYCDRWTANLLYDQPTATNHLRLSLEPQVYPSEPNGLSPQIPLNTPFTMVVREENLPLCTKICQDLDLTHRELTTDNWVIVFVAAQSNATEAPVLSWKGYGPQMDVSPEALRTWCDQAKNAMRSHRIEPARTILNHLLAAWPDYLPALQLKRDLFSAANLTNDTAALERQIQQLMEPQIGTDIAFRNGIVLRGISVENSTLRQGEDLEIAYYWKIPTHCDTDSFAVFAHLRNSTGDMITSDDRVLFDDFQRIQHPDEQSYISHRTMKFPKDLGPGAYTLNAGLYLSNPPHDRIAVSTPLPARNNSIRLPLRITID